MKDTKTPVVVAFFAFIINAIFGYILGFKLGLNHLGLALASSISSIFNFLILLFILNKRVTNIFDNAIFIFVLKVLFISLIAALISWKLSLFGDWSTSSMTAGKVGIFFLSVVIPVLIYFVLSKIFGLSETNKIVKLLRKK